jgi:hypothetical protein
MSIKIIPRKLRLYFLNLVEVFQAATNSAIIC